MGNAWGQVTVISEFFKGTLNFIPWAMGALLKFSEQGGDGSQHVSNSFLQPWGGSIRGEENKEAFTRLREERMEPVPRQCQRGKSESDK